MWIKYCIKFVINLKQGKKKKKTKLIINNLRNFSDGEVNVKDVYFVKHLNSIEFIVILGDKII